MKKPTWEDYKEVRFQRNSLIGFTIGLSLLLILAVYNLPEAYDKGKEAGYNQCISDYKNITKQISDNKEYLNWVADDKNNYQPKETMNSTGEGYGYFELVNETPQWIAGIETTPSNEDILVISSPEDEIISFSQNGTIVYKGKTLMNNREVSNALIDLTLNREQYCDKFKENSK